MLGLVSAAFVWWAAAARGWEGLAVGLSFAALVAALRLHGEWSDRFGPVGRLRDRLERR
jgi:hypothetical protein